MTGTLSKSAGRARESLEILERSTPVTPKHSRAIGLWLIVLSLVLLLLWMATSQTRISSYNFFIDGDRLAAGAEVLVDGRPVGKLADLQESGVQGVAVRLSVPDGYHDIEIRKTGFQTFHTEIRMSGEDYLAVHLKPNAP